MKACLNLILLITVVTFIGCKKNPLPAEIIGTWELREEYGGFGGKSTLPQGNGNRFEFTGERFKLFRHGDLVRQGIYSIQRHDGSDMIFFSGDRTFSRTLIVIAGNQMTLSQDGYDGGGEMYERQ